MVNTSLSPAPLDSEPRHEPEQRISFLDDHERALELGLWPTRVQIAVDGHLTLSGSELRRLAILLFAKYVLASHVRVGRTSETSRARRAEAETAKPPRVLDLVRQALRGLPPRVQRRIGEALSSLASSRSRARRAHASDGQSS